MGNRERKDFLDELFARNVIGVQQFLERHVANTIGLSKAQHTSGARKRAGSFVFNPYDILMEETISSLSEPACLPCQNRAREGKRKQTPILS
jgi:hypothetical protein